MQAAPLPELVDIIAPTAAPPAAPAYGAWIFIILLIILIIIAFIIARQRRNKTRSKALALLGKTRSALQQHQITPRAAAFAVGHALQGVPHDDPPLTELLDRARYAPQAPEHDSALQLLHMAQATVRSAGIPAGNKLSPQNPQRERQT